MTYKIQYVYFVLNFYFLFCFELVLTLDFHQMLMSNVLQAIVLRFILHLKWNYISLDYVLLHTQSIFIACVLNLKYILIVELKIPISNIFKYNSHIIKLLAL